MHGPPRAYDTDRLQQRGARRRGDRDGRFAVHFTTEGHKTKTSNKDEAVTEAIYLLRHDHSQFHMLSTKRTAVVVAIN